MGRDSSASTATHTGTSAADPSGAQAGWNKHRGTPASFEPAVSFCSMPAKILLLSASVGAGHLRAAQAVELALRELVPDALLRNLDVLTLTNAMFRRLYGSAYLDL